MQPATALARATAAEAPAVEARPHAAGDRFQPLRVGIIGGGIAGLAAGHFLARAGHVPVVLESSAQLGGLGTHFEHRGVSIEQFYHVILDTDADLRTLLDDLGLTDRLVFQKTGMGFLVDGVLYGFNTPLDLLRFRALPLRDRLRTAMGALYITRLKRQALDLDDVPARDWLVRVFGPRVVERIWDPLLRAKFGELRHGIPAYWVWNTLTREKNGSQEVKGYVRGGYRVISDALHKEIVASGGEVRTHSPVSGIDAHPGTVRVAAGGTTEAFDAVISTVPLPLLARMLGEPFRELVRLPQLQYQGVVNVVVVSRARLERFCWTAVVDPTFAFQGVVETTNVIPLDSTGGRHLIYLMNYCSPDSEMYQRADDLLKRQAVEGLAALYPAFDPAAVEAVYVFRAPHVEPAWTVGYLRRRPPIRVGSTRLYLCTTAHAYPKVTAWNTSVGLARDTVRTLTTDLGQPRQRLATSA
jgi:protoporphyrinogen oxidase